ncbi:hypothetical protein WA026_003900 [Henosepilachna vigintioctopunctata]|uniref:BRCT domain-containing protein n=1 Tax=Henosepilachna vigintioctopunctata TaxID=420089 RepID=A0AAW1U5W1_9CUCU
MDSVTVIFVLSNKLNDETEAGEVMLQAFEACKQNKVNSSWVKEKDINALELKKTDFIVFENFDGRDFGSIIKQKSASILGPWCVLICLMEGKKIPNFQWPIYNVAMYNCFVTTSHLPKKSKIAISEKVQSMGGYYTDSLTENITHLISDSVKTAKYSKGIEMNVKIMTPAWIDAVWNASQQSNVHCNDDQFKKFKCLPFHKLVISSTGLTNSNVREEIKRLITINGGEYTGKLNLSITDFLICEGANGCMSEKYREARKTGTIHCVTLQWLYDSVEKGYCVQHDQYTVQKGTSTPQKDNHINPDFSTMSAINNSKFEKTSVDDTIQLSNDKISNGVKRKAFSEYHALIEQIDIKRAKRSGQFLDGCSVYLVGFNGDHREKLCKIINASGATRCDDMSDRVTHVIVGDTECHELKTIASKGYCCSIINLHWLLDSIERRRPCNEESYLVKTDSDHSKFRSPLGKKALNLLRTSRIITEVDLTVSQNEKEKIQDKESAVAERDIMQQYLVPELTEEDTLVKLLRNANYDSQQLGIQDLQERIDAGPSTSSLTNDSTLTSQDQSLRVFHGLSFFITGFEEEQEAELRDTIESALGKITKDINICKFVVTPSIIIEPLDHEHVMTVSDVWVFDCLNEQQIVEIQYYHRPLLIMNTSVLENCVVTISGYSGYERNFLTAVIVHLGATSQEQFCRITSEERNVLGSTHLVTAEASGKKYAASIKWRLPAVDKDWLIGCAKTGKRLPESEYLVSEKNSQDEHTFSNDSSKNSNKENISTDKSKTNDNSKNSVFGITASTDSSKSINVTKQGDVENEATDRETIENLDVGACSSKEPFDRDVQNVSSASTNNAVIGEYNTPKSSNTENSFTLPPPRISNFGLRDSKFKTPDRKVADEYCSQVTPVDKIMKEVRMTNLLGTPESPQLAKTPWDVDTPETPYGAYINPNPSKSLKKEMLRFLNQFPDRIPPPRRKLSTPLSELKRQLWAKIGSSQSQTLTQTQTEDDDDERSQDNNYETQGENCTQSALVNTRLQQLEEMMVAASGSANKSRRQSRASVPVPEHFSEARESQPCTVQWDFGKDTQEEPSPTSKVFMISGVNSIETRLKIVEQLEKLGANVSESSSYDPNSTHLLCPKPARNEKTLSCMASGKWILHTNYVDACVNAEKFLDEEEYEFGNSHSIGKISIELDRDLETRMQAIYYWRNEIARTGRRPFHDMRAIVVAEKKQPLITVIEAGGGTIVNAEPPFTDTVHATHCLLEAKSMDNFSVYEPLAKQGIYCVNTVYISDFLNRTSNDIKDSILPYFQKYFR